MKTNKLCQVLAATFGALFAVQTAYGHVTISPTESGYGDRESYTMRVPTERDSSTIRIEAEFPDRLTVSDLEAKDGWTVEPITNTEGRIVGAVWSGGSIAPGQAQEFSFTAFNPAFDVTLMWEILQVHADGSTVEWAPEVVITD